MAASLDPAIWRRFDEVIWFECPYERIIARFLGMKFRNVSVEFDPKKRIAALGYSYAELDRICLQAIKASIIDKRKKAGVHGRDIRRAQPSAPHRTFAFGLTLTRGEI